MTQRESAELKALERWKAVVNALLEMIHYHHDQAVTSCARDYVPSYTWNLESIRRAAETLARFVKPYDD